MSFKTTQDYHADCIATATNIIAKHPYFIADMSNDCSSITFIDDDREAKCWNDLAFGVSFKTKNGETGPDAVFALGITKIIKERHRDIDYEYETERFEIVLVKKSTDEDSRYHVVHKALSINLNTGVTVRQSGNQKARFVIIIKARNMSVAGNNTDKATFF